MRLRKVLQGFLGWVPQNRRSRLLGALAAVTLVAAVVAGSIYPVGRSEAPPVTPATPTPLPPLACDAPPLIDPLLQGAEDGWRRGLAPPAADCFSPSPTVEDVRGI